MSKNRLGKREREDKRNRILRSLQIREAHALWKTFEDNYDRCVRDLNTVSSLLEELKWLD